MKATYAVIAVLTGLSVAASPVWAGWPGGVGKCPADAVKAGSVCMDKYEASVWQVPATNPAGKSNQALIAKIQNGTATQLNLLNGGATQRGVSSDDYGAACPNNGQGCADLYAASLPGLIPSSSVTWFQAQQACFNARKRLPNNDEWQGAVSGTSDPGPDNGTTDCNTSSGAVVNTGLRSGCVSRWGAFDMVGNLTEWVANWVAQSSTCGHWAVSVSDDAQCLAGAKTTGEPGALLRGGDFDTDTAAGPFTVSGRASPTAATDTLGFRCAR